MNKKLFGLLVISILLAPTSNANAQIFHKLHTNEKDLEEGVLLTKNLYQSANNLPQDPIVSGLNTIAAGGNHTCVLTSNNRVKCWGYNNYGQLGDGTTEDGYLPVDVIGLSNDMVAVAAGKEHTCALTSGGGVKCWGYNNYGQLGDGTTEDRHLPVDVIGLSSDMVSIAAGKEHSCALTTGGGVKCWGHNFYGQLGNGTFLNDYTLPVDVVGLSSGVVAITAGEYHMCALTSIGSVKCWGYNNAGQLGVGAILLYVLAPLPVDVSGLSSGVVAISAGREHTCALTSNGGVKCWGSNDSWQIGDGLFTSVSSWYVVPLHYYYTSPVDVIGLSNGVVAIAAGGKHTCALTSNDGVKCWGANDAGQLGDGMGIRRYEAVNVVGLSNEVLALAAGGGHTCALTTSGGIKCWGANYLGELGVGTDIIRHELIDVVGLPGGVSAITIGQEHTCAVTSDGGAKCWGDNSNGQLGDNTTVSHYDPGDVIGLSSGVSTIAAGAGHTCAITSDGKVKCWGANNSGQIGDGLFVAVPDMLVPVNFNYTSPVDVVGLINSMFAVATGSGHTCAVSTMGGVKCWGANELGQLGDGTTEIRYGPVNVTGLSNGVVAISVGGMHACALTSNGGVKCWGINGAGQLGDGTREFRLGPVDVTGLSNEVVAIAAGNYYTCALTSNGGVKCWGSNHYGQLGDGTTEDRYSPADVVGLSIVVAAIASGMFHTCALTSNGGVKCWGSNYYGQLGDGTIEDRYSPVNVVGLSSGVVAIAAGGEHTCALTSNGGVKCWGNRNSGQLGAPIRDNFIPRDVGNPTFSDVPITNWGWMYIERLYASGLTGGCSTSSLYYCPDESVTRAQMAVLLEKGLHYPSVYTAPNVAPTFTDTVGHWAEDWIEALRSDGITSGCGAGVYCPEEPVTRAQMAVFLLKAKHGSLYTPPAAAGAFTDVPVGYWADKWIEQLAAEGITSGCGVGIYCPESLVTRAQMAVFLAKVFNLPLP